MSTRQQWPVASFQGTASESPTVLLLNPLTEMQCSYQSRELRQTKDVHRH